MKYFLLMGGFAGFAAVLIASFYAGNRPAVALRDAAIACLIGGMLFRMLHAAYISGIKGYIAEKSRASKGDDLADGLPQSGGRRG